MGRDSFALICPRDWTRFDRCVTADGSHYLLNTMNAVHSTSSLVKWPPRWYPVIYSLLMGR